MPEPGAGATSGDRTPGGFNGKVVLVSGAAHGIGRAIASAFATRGARVWTCDVLADQLDETVRQIRGLGGAIEGRVCDITDSAAVNALVAEIAGRDGGVHILVHAAGGVTGQVWKPIDEVTDEDWRRIVAVNQQGAFHLIRAVAPAMKARGWGRIITISSGAGRSYSQTGILAYASAKAGLIGLTRQVARELGPYGVTANSIAPGFVLSNPASIKQWEALGPDGQRAFFTNLAIKRLGVPEDMAFAALFFAADEASYITGQTISVDGGRWMLG
ncbi:MAG: SDR family NAD(P)-dependent oxidoreductase [Armatimonadota bacterium]|nr:SDR family NAD(P)-dependent oxidoreductase [Armatimonadota bacterium]